MRKTVKWDYSTYARWGVVCGKSLWFCKRRSVARAFRRELAEQKGQWGPWVNVTGVPRVIDFAVEENRALLSLTSRR